jgi:hypothetical protein
MKSSFKKIILFIVIIFIVTIVAVLVFGKKNTATTKILQATNLSTTTSQTSTNDSSKFLQSLSQVRDINLDTTFFKNKAYQKLVDLSLTPVIEDTRIIGRPNPFAPIGTDYITNSVNNSNDIVDQNPKKPN